MTGKKKKRAAKKRKKTTKRSPSIRIRKDIRKEFAEAMGKGNVAEVMSLESDDAASYVRDRVSTQSLSLDRHMRSRDLNGSYQVRGGIPLGRVTEVYGPPFIGKSTLLDHILAAVQQMGGEAVLFDNEVSRDRYYTQCIGVDLAKLWLIEMKRATIEAVFNRIVKAIDFWKVKAPETPVIIGWDSLGKTSTEEELKKFEAELEKPSFETEEKKGPKYQPGSAARALHLMTRHLAPRLGGTRIGLVIINHEYEAIESRPSFYKKRNTYGGSALQYTSSVRLELRFKEKGTIKSTKGWPIGREIVIKLAKNRCGEVAEAVVPILNNIGISNLYTVFGELKRRGLIVVAGNRHVLNLNNQEIKFAGFEGLYTVCREQQELWPLLLGAYETVMEAENANLGIRL
jgi:RecA/RadA recombinase